MARVLAVDDEAAVSMVIVGALEMKGHEVAVANTGEEGIRLAREGAFDVALVDLKLPGIDGLEVACLVAHHCPKTRVMVMSGYDFGDVDVGFPTIKKPFDIYELQRMVAGS